MQGSQDPNTSRTYEVSDNRWSGQGPGHRPVHRGDMNDMGDLGGFNAPRNSGTTLQAGVGGFMASVYGWMSAGVAVSAVLAMLVAQLPVETLMAMYSGPGRWIMMLAPFGMVMFLGARVHKMSPGAAMGAFLAFAGMMGVSLASIAFVALHSPAFAGTVFQALFVSAGMFAAMAALGYTTRKDLSGFGTFFTMALFGIILAQIANMFMHSASFSMGISGVAVLLFAGLTAYDAQKIKQVYLVNGGRGNLAVLGALTLYLDFLNLFLHLLRLMSGSRDE